LRKLKFRVGTGFDFHPFEDGKRLVLGGIEIPYHRGLKGHSDADALLHAVADAMLGAAGLKDIGIYFPDTETRFHNISSLLILEKVFRIIREKGFEVGNIDVTVLAEEPKIQLHVEAIKASLAQVLHLQSDEVGIKATTMEGLGCVGRAEGLAVQVVVLLVRRELENQS